MDTKRLILRRWEDTVEIRECGCAADVREKIWLCEQHHEETMAAGRAAI